MKKTLSFLMCCFVLITTFAPTTFANNISKEQDVSTQAIYGAQSDNVFSKYFENIVSINKQNTSTEPNSEVEVVNPFYLIPSVIVSVVTMMPYYLTVGFLTLISPFVLVFGFVESTIYHRNPDLYQKLVDLGIFDPVIESSNIVV